MSNTETYYQQRLPDLIKRLKSQVKKNFVVMVRPVESDLGSDRYFNVQKGRRLSAENSLAAMKQISRLEQEAKIETDNDYYKTLLPDFIDHLKQMVDITLEVIDIEIDEDDEVEFKDQIGDEIKEIFGPEMSKKIFRSLKDNSKLSEDKYVNVLKARNSASEDAEWALKRIDELENELKGKDKSKKKESWALRAATA